ncbi:hypothetical protein SEEE0268_03673 [Salmonella enterica subsp. enterica serovar Enteritidis str. 648902 6-8]|nr:hypothetical protein SEEE0268_03673 [Salmonella enterica subsp. enterica serovar Enteritidis str. 648902 6-8]
MFIHFQRDGGDFEQRIGFSVKSCSFNVDDDRIKTTKNGRTDRKVERYRTSESLNTKKCSAYYGKFYAGMQ